MHTLAEKVAVIASGEIGVTEVDGTNSGVRVKEYQAATALGGTGWPWCAAFCCWVIREAMKTDGPYTFRRPTTAAAFGFEAWSLAQDDSTNTKKPARGDIRSGDIVIFKFSHIGFAVGSPDKDGWFRSVEGNTDKEGSREGGGVFRKWRNVSQLRSRIRFTV